MTVTGGSYAPPNLTDVDGSSLYVSGGGSLSLPGVTSYAADFSTFQAQGTGSVLDVSALSKLTQVGFWIVDAYSGGEIKLSGLTSLTSTEGISITSITDTGVSAILDPKLTSLSNVNVTLDGTDAHLADAWQTLSGVSLNLTGGSCALSSLTGLSGSSLGVGSGATLTLPPASSLSATNSTVSVGAGGTLNVGGQVFNMPVSDIGVTINVPALPLPAGLSLEINNANYTGGTTLNVGAGTTVGLAGGSYLGGVTFNVAAGATADLTGGQTTTYGGTLTGSGLGTVQFSGGLVEPALGGVTLDFHGNTFQWTGGGFAADSGDVTNVGTINLAGDSDKGLYADGTLYNYGTIIQTGSGNIDLHSDNLAPTTLDNERGASYLIESDSGIDNFLGGIVAVVNSGEIVKTAGSGTSQLYVNGALSNTGTIEADSGTLFVDANTINQVSGGALTGGTWNAMNGAALQFPGGTSITANAASVTLSGAGATISALAGLAANSGSLSVSNGAAFTTAGNLSSSGSLTVGAGSTLAVGGGFVQTSTGTLAEQIGGTPASGLFGQVAVTGTATLGGRLGISLVNGFGPSPGQHFPVITYLCLSRLLHLRDFWGA